jgi:tetratricopeptide (TPR) repeat protein
VSGVSFLKRMFGGATAADEGAEADRLFEAGKLFEARQAYERVLAKGKDAPDLARHAEERLAKCFDGLAEQRLEEARRLRDDGQIETAKDELASAIELARSPAVRERARRALETIERRDAVEQAAEIQMSDDDRWAVIAGQWEDAQIEEYDEYGEEFRQALLAMHDQKTKEARPVLEKLLEAHGEDATYLWLEVGRARSNDGDEEGAGKALRRFLKRLASEDDDNRSDARLNAHIFLCALAEKRNDEEKALSWLRKAIDAMPDDPRPYLHMGVFLRQKGHAAEAVEVFETAIGLIDEDRPSWEAWQELGLAKKDLGEDDAAIELFEAVVKLFTSRRLDFPPVSAVALAGLYEKRGRLERAADLYRSLASGGDRANHLEYHRQAARVLEELGLLAEARRMLTRAAALAEGEADVLAEVEAKIAQIDARL